MNLPEPRDEAPAMRVGHADRDAVVARLQQANAEGRLSLEELEQRVEAALAARTSHDLAPLVADLPADAPAVARTGGPGYSPDDPLRISAGMESEKRTGRWTIPPWIVVNPGFGTLRLDCRVATAAEPVITIQVNAGAGSLLLIVPEGWGANLDRLDTAFGSKRTQVPDQPAPGKPLIRFEGQTGLNSVTVRHEKWWDRKIKDA